MMASPQRRVGQQQPDGVNFLRSSKAAATSFLAGARGDRLHHQVVKGPGTNPPGRCVKLGIPNLPSDAAVVELEGFLPPPQRIKKENGNTHVLGGTYAARPTTRTPPAPGPAAQFV